MSSSSERFHRSTTFISSHLQRGGGSRRTSRSVTARLPKVLEVERKFARDIAYGMDCDGLRITSIEKAVLS
jgi:hypothetical protein